MNDQRPMWRQVQKILDDEFHPGDDTYKGVAKDIHLLYLEAGWEPSVGEVERDATKRARWLRSPHAFPR